jgi:hypothetical protein
MTIIALRDMFAKSPKYRRPKIINWKHSFNILMDSVEEYDKQETKRDRENIRFSSRMGCGCEIQIEIKTSNGVKNT